MAPPSLLFDIFLLGVSRIQHYSFFSVDYHFHFLYSLGCLLDTRICFSNFLFLF